MKSLDGTYLHIGRRLTLTVALLIALILGGNGFVIFQFERARIQTDRLTGLSQQLVAVRRLQESLLSFHQRLDELAQARDVRRLVTEAGPLHAALLQQTRDARRTLAYLPSEVHIDPTFVTALDTIETTLPSQLQDITDLARAGDWDSVRLRLDNELRRIEATTSAHVKNIDRDLDDDLPRVVANMKDLQRRIFVILPATAISTVLIAAFFGWAIARRILELRVEERVGERTRIARELHDTLLQSFQAVLMKFHSVTYMLPDHPEAQTTLEAVIAQARRAVSEGRDAVQGLRSSGMTTNDLAETIRAFGEELAAEPGIDQAGHNRPEFRVRVEGSLRDLAPRVVVEVRQIAFEVVRNAFQHAEARLIEVEIRYGERQLRLRVRDNGKGIPPDVLASGRAGHYGLPGVQERTKLLGGKLAMLSRLGSGTDAELTIPASSAYLKSPPTRRSMASGTET
jgi:signal transduction histidine kinase